MSAIDIVDLKNKTIFKVGVKEDEEVHLYLTDGNVVRIFHEQDCCEHVYLADMDGDWEDLLHSPLIMAQVSTNRDEPPIWSNKERDNINDYYSGADDTWTWTFYKFATNKGYVTLRWFGTSNGYYSEQVSLVSEYKPEIYAQYTKDLLNKEIQNTTESKRYKSPKIM